MAIGPRRGWFAAFTAVFAVCAAYVFWDAWSAGVAPVMPDCPVSYPVHWFREAVRAWLENGKFAPAEAVNWIGSPYFWTEFQYVFAAYMAALGLAYFLAGRGLPLPAAYGAGLFLAFSGYWFTLFSAGHLGWFQWMTYGVFAFGLSDRALEKGETRHWLMLGACLAWGSMRQPDMWLLFTAFTGAYFLFRASVVFAAAERGARKPLAVSRLKGASVALAALLAIGGASFRSALQDDLAGRDRQIEEGQTLGAKASGDAAERRWIFATNWSMPPEATKEFFVPGAEGDTSCPMTLAIGRMRRSGVRPYTGRLGRPYGAPSGNYRQHSLYVGRATCIFALLALAAAFSGAGRKRRKEIAFFSVAAAAFWLFSMGRYCESVYRIVYALPFGDYLRAPVKWHHLTEFCICVLAGYGMAALLESGAFARFVPCKARLAVLCAAVLAGTADLASNDRLYFAPRRADCDLQFADARIVRDPRGIEMLGRMRAKPVGMLQDAVLLEVPKERPGEKKDLPRPKPFTLFLGILSLAGTACAGAYCAGKALK